MRSVAWGFLLVFPLTTYAQDQVESGSAIPPVSIVVPLSPANDRETELSVDSWEEVQVGSLKELLNDNLRDPNFKLKDPRDGSTQLLAQKLGVSDPQVTVRKNYPPDPNPDGLPEPYLSISFDAAENVIGDSEIERLATVFVNEVLTQNYFSQKFMNKLPAEMKNKNGGFVPAVIKVWVGPEDNARNPFQSPRGLSMPWQVLAHRLGHLSSPNSTLSVAFTPAVCRDLSYDAIKSGLYEDAIVLANHGLSRSPIVDPALLYMRAYSEIILGKGGEATETIKDLKATRRYPYKLQERLNGPPAVYLRHAFSTIK